MPHIERTIEIVWDGNLARGNGTITGQSGAFTDLPFSLPSRIAVAQGKTSPEELLAAAHAGCLTMSIVGELTAAGTPPGRLEVTCTVVMDEVEGQGHEIVASHVTLAGDEVPDEIVERADQGCPFSRLLKKAGVEVTITRS
jgi:osmotically inducible protein OsmC